MTWSITDPTVRRVWHGLDSNRAPWLRLRGVAPLPNGDGTNAIQVYRREWHTPEDQSQGPITAGNRTTSPVVYFTPSGTCFWAAAAAPATVVAATPSLLASTTSSVESQRVQQHGRLLGAAEIPAGVPRPAEQFIPAAGDATGDAAEPGLHIDRVTAGSALSGIRECVWKYHSRQHAFTHEPCITDAQDTIRIQFVWFLA